MKKTCKLSELNIGERGIVKSLKIQNKEIRRIYYWIINYIKHYDYEKELFDL